MSCRSRLAELNEKLTALERKVEYVEASVSRNKLTKNTQRRMLPVEYVMHVQSTNYAINYCGNEYTPYA